MAFFDGKIQFTQLVQWEQDWKKNLYSQQFFQKSAFFYHNFDLAETLWALNNYSSSFPAFFYFSISPHKVLLKLSKTISLDWVL